MRYIVFGCMMAAFGASAQCDTLGFTPEQVELDGYTPLVECAYDQGFNNGYTWGFNAAQVAPDPCPADVNGDGFVSTADLIALLGYFETTCEE